MKENVTLFLSKLIPDELEQQSFTTRKSSFSSYYGFDHVLKMLIYFEGWGHEAISVVEFFVKIYTTSRSLIHWPEKPRLEAVEKPSKCKPSMFIW